MSTQVITQTHANGATETTTGGRGGHSGRNRRGGARGGGNNQNQNQNRNRRGHGQGQGQGRGKANADTTPTNQEEGTIEKNAVVDAEQEKVDEEDEGPVCWICAEPVKYWAVPECNHKTCHVCALRLRALYKKMDCTFCKEPQNAVIFTSSAEATFASFSPESIPYKDSKLSIFFETRELMEETLMLLRFNCPEPDCDYFGNGWGDLRLHARAHHGKLMCELCTRFKKVFAHEHVLYPPNWLSSHVPSMYRPPNHKPPPRDQIEGGVHPLCEFCKECFFGDDELYKHMRENHEECFLCKRNEVRDQYFQNYPSLERHFNNAHFPCTQAPCLAQKFVVFNSSLDLQAHMVEEHGATMTSRDKRNAQRVQADFNFEDSRRPRRDREPPPQYPPQQPQPPPSSTQTQIRQAGNSRRRDFGASLTAEGSGGSTGPSQTPPIPELNRMQSSSPGLSSDADPATLERHGAFIARLSGFAANPATAVPAVKAAIRGYKASETTARDLILTIWNILDRNLDYTASVINAFVDLLEEEEKKQDVLGSWRGFAIEQRRERQEEVVPTAVGSGYANIASGRVINAKHSFASRAAQQRQVHDRVARAASASSSSPFLSHAGSSSSSSRPGAAGAGAGGRDQTPLGRFFPPAPAPVSQPAALRGTWASRKGTAPPPTIAPPNQPAFGPTPKEIRSQLPAAVLSSGAPPAAPAPAPSSSFSLSSTSSFPTQTPVSIPANGYRPSAPKRQPPPPKLSNALFPELPSSSVGNQKAKAPVKGNAALKHILGNNTAPVTSVWQSGGGGGGSALGAMSSSSSNAGSGVNGDLVEDGANGRSSLEGAGAVTGAKQGGGKKKGKQKQTLFTLGAFPA